MCTFWRAVRKEWERRVGTVDPKDFVALDDRFTRLRSPRRLLYEKLVPSESFRTYSRYIQGLFKAIAAVSGSAWIVDSSRRPSRALALSWMPGIDLYVMHLVRDVRGVTWSGHRTMRRKPPSRLARKLLSRSALPSVCGWLQVNLHAGIVRRLLGRGRSIRLRYEDLMEDPEGSLRRVGRLLELDASPIIEALRSEEEIPIGHLAYGNRIRRMGSVRLRPDVEWRECLSARHEWIAWLVSGIPMLLYGYRPGRYP